MSAEKMPNIHGLSLPGRVQIDALRRALNPAHPRSGRGEPCVCGAVQGALPRPAACEGLMRLLELGESRRMEDAAAAAVGTRADSGAELVAASLFAAGLGRLAWPSPWTSLGLLWRLAVHGEWVVMPAQARALRTGRAHSISKPVMPGDVVGWHRFPGGDLGVVEMAEGPVWTCIQVRMGRVYRRADDRAAFLKQLAGIARARM